MSGFPQSVGYKTPDYKYRMSFGICRGSVPRIYRDADFHDKQMQLKD